MPSPVGTPRTWFHHRFSMIVLAFQYWRGAHDSSAALVADGRLVAAAEEERFSRIKHDGSVPVQAIGFCLAHAGIRMSDVDVVAFPSKPFRSGPDSGLAEVDIAALRRLRECGAVRGRTLLHKRLLTALLPAGLPPNLGMNQAVTAGIRHVNAHFGPLPPMRFFGHHEAHAAATFLASEFDRAAVATVDGRGGHYATMVWRGEGHRVTALRGEPYTNSLGRFYEDCTRHLGFDAFGEGKAMGLASYGDPGRLRKIVGRLLDTTMRDRWYAHVGTCDVDSTGFQPRTCEDPLTGQYKDFAAGAQDALEAAMLRITRDAVRRAGADRLCLGGGVILNCSANGRIADEGVASSSYIFPAAGDAGLSVGAALLAAAEAGMLAREPIAHAYWGPEYGDDACERALMKEPQVTAHRSENVAAETAGLLASGHVVGWMQGRMEFGPRALGNRSILADPRKLENRDRVNRVKRRERWRPLAPVVLEDVASEFFQLAEASPFMLVACDVRPAARERIPAVVHVDGSARPQTVNPEQNERLHALLTAFGRITGVPVLLNTSFNDAGEPIVCSPADALRTFLATEMDILVLGDYIVRRAEARAAD
jgi:carbamoyltransferase